MSDNVIHLTEETVTKHYAEVVINGSTKGKREINGTPTLLAFATGLAQEFGIRTFTITMDGAPVTDPKVAAATPVTSDSRVSVQAKDSRGSDLHTTMPDATGCSTEVEEAETSEVDETDLDAQGHTDTD